MLSIATIVFREFLEIALVLGVVMAATQGLPKRGMLAIAGLALGVIGSAVIALFTSEISDAMEGMGQEVFNATIMFVAVGFLSWTVIWMRRHARTMTAEMRQMGQAVLAGNKPLYVVALVIALATLREGAEIVLFSYGQLAGNKVTMSEVLMGAALGGLGGTLVGWALYMGLLKAARKHLFAVTSWMLILLSAGMAAQGASFLIAADMLPALSPQLWDSSWFIAGDSTLGQTLGVLIGYTARPSGMELLAYLIVLVSVGLLYHRSGSSHKPAQPAPAAA